MQIIKSISKETYDYGIKLLNVFGEWSETEGEGIKIAILDSGIDYLHEDLKARVKGGINYTTDDTTDYMDRCGHGTFCAGIIGASENGKGLIGVAPKADIYAVKILDDKGQGSLNWLCQGIEWCINNDIDVISMSIGYQTSTPEIQIAVADAYKKGIIMIAAVGNNNTESEVEYPARYPEVIGVTAVDSYEHIGNFCTHGDKVEVAAAGVNVTSTYLHNLYANGSGTSFAAPHITGAIALIQSGAIKHFGHKLDFIEIKKFIDMHVQHLGGSEKNSLYGYGLFHF